MKETGVGEEQELPDSNLATAEQNLLVSLGNVDTAGEVGNGLCGWVLHGAQVDHFPVAG